MSRAGFALGQELTATPLQIALAYGAVANGGWLVEPTLVHQTVMEKDSADDDGPHRVMDGALAGRLTRMLSDVVEVGIAAGNGYLWTRPTGRAFPRPDDED